MAEAGPPCDTFRGQNATLPYPTRRSMSERNDSAGPHQAGQASIGARSDTPPPRDHVEHVVLRHVLRVVLAFALVVYFIVAVLLLGLRYVVLPHVDALRPRIEAIVSEKIHADFRIGRLAPHWSGFQPGIDVTDLTIRDRNGTLALNVPHASASVAWRSLILLEPLLSSVVVERPNVLIERDDDGTLLVAGVPMPTAHTGNATFTTWLLRQQAIVLRGGTLRWRDATRDVPELALSDLRLAILNDGYEHRFALQAPSEGSLLHGPLDFRASFTHAHGTVAGKPSEWQGDAYLSTGPVDLPTLARYVDLPIATYAGRINNTIWANFAHGRLLSAHGVLDGRDVALRVRATQPRLDLPIAHFDWQVGTSPGDYTLKLTDFHAELGQPPLDDGTPLTRALALSTLSAHFRQQNLQHGQLLSVTGDRIDLGILAEFMRALPLPGRVLNALVRFNPRGLVANYDLALERAKPESGEAAAEQRTSSVEPVVHYRFKADLQGISVAAQEPPPGLTPRNHPRAGLPGFENLWGHIDADEARGTISLDTSNVAVTLPGVFDDPRLTFDRLTGAANWTVAPERAPGETHKAFQVNVQQLGVANADARATMSASYANPGHGRGSLDLKAQFDHAEVNRIARYLPTSISEKLRVYLGHGLQGGVSKGGTIEIHGDLTKFPYSRDPEAGQFRIVAPFTGGRFDPTPFPPKTLRNGAPNVWPAFDRIDGVFSLKENKLRFDVARGYYHSVVLTGVSGRIDDLGTRASDLVISGNGRGPLAEMLDYANNSSIGYLTKHVGEKVHAQGPATLALKLDIPRVPKPKVKVEGSLGFLGNQLAADNVPPVSNLTGTVRFSNRSAQVEHLAARFLGGDLHADGGLSEDGRYALDLSGHVAIDAARGLGLHGPAAAALGVMSGRAPYALNVRGARGRLPDVTASSDLTDLALDLPAPFGKSAGTPMPLRLSFQPGTGDDPKKAGMQHAELTFGPVAARYELRHVPGKPPEVVRGAIGVNRPADLPSEGVTAAVDLPTFDADAWRHVFVQLRAAAGLAPMVSGSAVAVPAQSAGSRSGDARAAGGSSGEPVGSNAGVAAGASVGSVGHAAQAAPVAPVAAVAPATPIAAAASIDAAKPVAPPGGAGNEANRASAKAAAAAAPSTTTASTIAAVPSAPASAPDNAALENAAIPPAPSASAATAAPAAAASTQAAAPGEAATPAASPLLPSGAFAQYLPSRFAVHVGNLTLLKRHWENLVVGASRSGNQWQANIASNQVSGHLSWHPGATPGAPGTLQARLARLVVPAATENDLLGQAISAPAQNMPAIDLVVNQLIVRGRDFGRLQVDAHNFDDAGVPVWQLDALDISNPAAHLTASANWRNADNLDATGNDPQSRRTAIDFRLDIKDAGALLERAGLPRTLKAGVGTLTGNANWQGGPTRIDYPTFNGNLTVDLRHGQILKVDPGVAKLLGVLSLQSLARYATMDFRDVIGEGLPFESVTGTGQIQNGIASTHDFKMITAPARVEVGGTIDLAHETQALRVHVAPTVSVGAGVIAAAVINPLIGLGALVADFALSHSIETALAMNYQITGSWSKPHVERVHGDQGKMGNQPAPAAISH